MKKKMFITLDERSAKVVSEKFTAKKEAKVAWLPEPKKDTELFLMNVPAKAIQKRKRVKTTVDRFLWNLVPTLQSLQ
jgi:hypothetical protein